MYRFDWLERVKLQGARRNLGGLRSLSPVVWALGFTSLLTDISSGMVISVLPEYLFWHLKLGPLQYGVIDGFYTGFAVMLVGLLSGCVADRQRRQVYSVRSSRSISISGA